MARWRKRSDTFAPAEEALAVACCGTASTGELPLVCSICMSGAGICCVVSEAARNSVSRKQVAQLMTWFPLLFLQRGGPRRSLKGMFGVFPHPPSLTFRRPWGPATHPGYNTCPYTCKIGGARGERGGGWGPIKIVFPILQLTLALLMNFACPHVMLLLNRNFGRSGSRIRVVDTAVCQYRCDGTDGQDAHLECLWKFISCCGSHLKDCVLPGSMMCQCWLVGCRSS